MPRAPRGKRVVDQATGRITVAGRAPNGEPEPYFDRTRGVWVAPWRREDGKVGKPTGRTRAAAVAARDRHIAEAAENGRLARLAEGFHEDTTVAELTQWWLTHIARHRVRHTTYATYEPVPRLARVKAGGALRAAVRQWPERRQHRWCKCVHSSIWS